MPIFRVKSVKIYTGQKNLHGHRPCVRDKYEVWTGWSGVYILLTVMTTRAPAVLNDSIVTGKFAQSRMKSCKAIEKSEERAPFTQCHVVCQCEHYIQPHIDPNILATFWSIAQKSSWECNRRISFPTSWLCDWQRVQHFAPFTIKAFPIQRAQF